MTTKNADLGYKGDWCEQTGDFAKKLGDREIMERNYQRAIDAYETGGWIEQALNVARKLGDRSRITDLENKLNQGGN